MEALLTTKDLAELLKVCPKTVLRLVRYGQLPPPVINHGKVRRWLVEQVEAFLERQRRRQ